MGYFDAIGKKITQTGQGMVQKTKDTAEVLKLNGLISDEQKRITTLQTEIGKRYYELHADSYEPDFEEAVTGIKDALAKIDAYSEQIKKLKGLVNCPNCGNAVPHDSPFCNVCGSQINKQLSGNVSRCPNCGLPLAPGASFCTNCGLKVQPAAPVQPAQPVAPVQPVQPVAPVAPVAPVQPAQPVAPVQPVQPVAPVEPDEPLVSTTTCPNCGKQLAPGTAFCTECGYHVGN